jgi:hypothetical protein
MIKIATPLAGIMSLTFVAHAHAERISASALFAAYERSEVVAEDSYNGRRLSISGRINRIKDAALGGLAIFLAAGKNDENVRCHFPKRASSAVAGLRVGDQANFVCTVDYRVNNSIHASACERN